MRFFSTLYLALKKGSRAALQFYPESPEQIELITSTAMKCGFSGGLVVDYPNSAKAKKYYLCLFAGVDRRASAQQMPTPLGVDADSPQFRVGVWSDGRTREEEKGKGRRRNKRVSVKSREWVLNKKERQRRQGREVRKDTKYSGRRRPTKF